MLQLDKLEAELKWYAAVEKEYQQSLHQAVEKKILLVLEHRFGAISPDLQRRIHLFGTETLEELAVAMHNFKTIDDTPVWLDANIRRPTHSKKREKKSRRGKKSPR